MPRLVKADWKHKEDQRDVRQVGSCYGWLVYIKELVLKQVFVSTAYSKGPVEQTPQKLIINRFKICLTKVKCIIVEG